MARRPVDTGKTTDLRGIGFPEWSSLGEQCPNCSTFPEASWKDDRARKEAPFDLRRVKTAADLPNKGSKIWIPSEPNPYDSRGAWVWYGYFARYGPVI